MYPPTRAPDCQHNQCDHVRATDASHAPVAVDVPFVHATAQSRSWLRKERWRILEPSNKSCTRVQYQISWNTIRSERLTGFSLSSPPIYSRKREKRIDRSSPFYSCPFASFCERGRNGGPGRTENGILSRFLQLGPA